MRWDPASADSASTAARSRKDVPKSRRRLAGPEWALTEATPADVEELTGDLTRATDAEFAPEIEALSFPAWDCQPYDRASPSGAGRTDSPGDSPRSPK